MLLIIMTTLASFGQKNIETDSVNIEFLFSNSIVFDPSQLILKVVYKNNTNTYIDVYRELIEGYRGDRFFNIAIEMEKLNQKKYSPHPLRFYINALSKRMEDSLRHYDLPKKKLPPKASDTLDLNLLTVAKSFFPGKYRFRAHLRVKNIRDEREYNDPNFEAPPPLDEIEYINSKWIYFAVKNEIQIQINSKDK